MDGSRFDRLTKSLSQGASRRTVLKGMLGIGGAATVAELAFDDAESARRPTPTPKPTATPFCTGGLACGPDCCIPGQSECCDNACCFGECYGEELCCPTGRVVCGGVACCAQGEFCIDGLCARTPPTPTATATATPPGGCSSPSDCGVCQCLDDYRYRCPECIRGQCGGSVSTCPDSFHCEAGGCVPDGPPPECAQNSDCGVPFCEGTWVMTPTCLIGAGVCYDQPTAVCDETGCNPQTAQCNPA